MKLCLTKARCGAGDHPSHSNFAQLGRIFCFPFSFHLCLSSLKKMSLLGSLFSRPKIPKNTMIQEKKQKNPPHSPPFLFWAQQRRQNPKIYRPTGRTHHDISWAQPAQGWSPILARSINCIDVSLHCLHFLTQSKV